jgi:hypothetical protein
MRRPVAVLDANALHSAAIRDFLLRLAHRGAFEPRWSAAIHEEWMRSLRSRRPDITVAQLQRIRIAMDCHFPHALVTGHEALIECLDLPDSGDRHVLTRNLRDFPSDLLEAHGVAAVDPDRFVLGILEGKRALVLRAVADHRAALKRPPRSPEGHLSALEAAGLGETAAALRPYLEQI